MAAPKKLPPLHVIKSLFYFDESAWVCNGEICKGGLVWKLDARKNPHYTMLDRIAMFGKPFAGGVTTQKNTNLKYQVILVPGYGYFLAHRLIWKLLFGDFDENLEIDHINRNTLDNSSRNLRMCTRTNNRKNRSSYKGATSQYVGVHFRKDKKHRPWCASVRENGRAKKLGNFATEREAALARDAYVVGHYNGYGNLNFPDSQPV